MLLYLLEEYEKNYLNRNSIYAKQEILPRKTQIQVIYSKTFIHVIYIYIRINLSIFHNKFHALCYLGYMGVHQSQVSREFTCGAAVDVREVWEGHLCFTFTPT